MSVLGIGNYRFENYGFSGVPRKGQKPEGQGDFPGFQAKIPEENEEKRLEVSPEEAQKKGEEEDQEKTETKEDIIVKPDGSRVLVITSKMGDREITKSVKLPDCSMGLPEKSSEKSKISNGPNVYTVYMEDEDMLYSGGNGTGLSFYIKWAEDSTEENPVMVAKGVDENGEEFEQRIHIKDINPNNATLVEMRALEAYTGVEKNGGLSSLPMETGDMGLNDRRNFMQMFKKQISDMALLKQREAVAYYEYSMRNYWDFLEDRGNHYRH